MAGGLTACPAAAGTAHPPLGEGTAHLPLGEARAPGVGCPQGWNVPRGGLSPAFYRVASKCNSPPDRICQSKLGLGSSEPAYRCWGENLVIPKDKWVASGISFTWSWLIFRAATFVCRLCGCGLYFPGPLDASPVVPLCHGHEVKAGSRTSLSALPSLGLPCTAENPFYSGFCRRP